MPWIRKHKVYTINEYKKRNLLTWKWILYLEGLGHEFLQGHTRVSFYRLQEADDDF